MLLSWRHSHKQPLGGRKQIPGAKLAGIGVMVVVAATGNSEG